MEEIQEVKDIVVVLKMLPTIYRLFTTLYAPNMLAQLYDICNVMTSMCSYPYHPPP